MRYVREQDVITAASRVTTRIRSFTRVILMLRWMGLGLTALILGIVFTCHLPNILPHSSIRRQKMVKYLGAIIIIIVVASGIETGAGLDRAIDALSLLFVIGVAVGHALGAKDGENKITRFGDGCVRGGWLGFLVGVSLIAGTDFAARMDFSMIMPAMAVALLAPLYGYFFKIITMQLE